MRVFQTLEVTICGGKPASYSTPLISFFVRIFQTLDVTIFGSANKFFHPKDIRFRARISNLGDLFWQHKNKSVHSKDILYRVKIEDSEFRLSHSCKIVSLSSEYFSKAHDMVDFVSKSPIANASAKRTPERFIALRLSEFTS